MNKKLLVLILLVALSIRLKAAYFYEAETWKIPYFGFDECLYYSMALNMLKTSPLNYTLKGAALAPISFWEHRSAYIDFPLFHHPPLFTWTYMVSQLFLGSSFMTGRLLNVALGVINIYTVYLIGKRISPGVGLLSAMFLAVSPLHIQLSAFVLMDMILAVFVSLFILYVIKMSEERSTRNLAVCGTVLGMGMLTKYTMALALPFLLLYVLNKKISYRDGLKVLLIGIAIFSPWVAWNLKVYDLPALWGNWKLAGSVQNVHVPFYAFFTFLPVVAPFSLLSYISAVRVFKDRDLKFGLLLLFLGFVIVFTISPIKEMRYLLPVLPPLAVLASSWVLTLKRRYRYAVILLTVAFSAFASYRIVLGSYFWYLDFWYYKNWYMYFIDTSTPMITNG